MITVVFLLTLPGNTFGYSEEHIEKGCLTDFNIEAIEQVGSDDAFRIAYSFFLCRNFGLVDRVIGSYIFHDMQAELQGEHPDVIVRYLLQKRFATGSYQSLHAPEGIELPESDPEDMLSGMPYEMYKKACAKTFEQATEIIPGEPILDTLSSQLNIAIDGEVRRFNCLDFARFKTDTWGRFALSEMEIHHQNFQNLRTVYEAEKSKKTWDHLLEIADSAKRLLHEMSKSFDGFIENIFNLP